MTDNLLDNLGILDDKEEIISNEELDDDNVTKLSSSKNNVYQPKRVLTDKVDTNDESLFSCIKIDSNSDNETNKKVNIDKKNISNDIENNSELLGVIKNLKYDYELLLKKIDNIEKHCYENESDIDSVKGSVSLIRLDYIDVVMQDIQLISSDLSTVQVDMKNKIEGLGNYITVDLLEIYHIEGAAYAYTSAANKLQELNAMLMTILPLIENIKLTMYRFNEKVRNEINKQNQ